MDQSNKNIIGHLKDNWIVYAFIAQLIATFVINNADHLEFRKDIVELQNYRSAETIQLSDIQTRLASIETSLKYIERAIK